MAELEENGGTSDGNLAPTTAASDRLQFTKEGKKHGTHHLIDKFDRETMGLSNYYKEEVLPKLLMSDHNLIAWLIKMHLLPTVCRCLVMYQQSIVRLIADSAERDGYKWLCNSCNDALNLRRISIFKGIDCSLPSCIRIIYGWVKGMDMDIMANLLGVKVQEVEKLYNKLAQGIKKFIQMQEIAHTWKVGGNDIIVLINIYPITMSDISTNKHSRPILCLSEIRSEPQKYWLEALDYLDEDNPQIMETIKQQIVNIVTDTVRPGSTLLLPKPSLLYDTLKDVCSDFYYVLNLDAIAKRDVAGGRSFNGILKTIWRKPLFVCEEAQYYNPNNIEQFLVRHWWRMMAGPFAFEGLIQLLKGAQC